MIAIRNIKVDFVLLLFAGMMLFISSCKTENENIDCSTYNYSDCNTIDPAGVNFHVKLTINPENTAVPITIYKGKLEVGEIFLYDTVTGTTYDTLLPADNFYTVAAKYNVGSTTVTAVDGDKVSKSSKTTCDSTCWSVKTGSANVKLK